MLTNPLYESRVYLGCDALYWISDGDCHHASFDQLPTELHAKHVIISEHWIRRDVLPADTQRPRLGAVGCDHFAFCEQGEQFYMCATLSPRAIELVSSLFSFEQVTSINPESDWICRQQGNGVFAWSVATAVTACLVSDKQVVRVGYWLSQTSEAQVDSWAHRIDSDRPHIKSLNAEQILMGFEPC